MSDGGTPTEPGRQRPQRAWWHRYLEPEERRRVMSDLALIRVDAWAFRFTVMLTLSVIVAVMGLSADSAAVVIGAMLLAPLMTPVLGLAASLSMALVNKSTRSAIRVTLATGWCITIAYLISLVLPDGGLPAEVISRTSPDLRDLVVALAAGFAGSYATVRRDASAALPGVAVAVALVPPLGTVGITLEAGRTDLAAGALLLYGTNLAAIILAGVVVFVVTGFVPPRRLAGTTPGILGGTVVAAAVVVAVALPLIRTSVAATRSAQTQQQVDETVATWLEGYDLEVNDVDVDADVGRVAVKVSGLAKPPDQRELERLLVPVLGADTRASVQWTKTEQATTTTAAVTSTTAVSDADRRLADVRAVIDEWLADITDAENAYDLEAVFLDGDDLRVDVVGNGATPSLDALTELLTEQLDEELRITLTWVPRAVVAPGSIPPTPVETRRAAMAQLVGEFAAGNDLQVIDLFYDGERISLELTGPEEPQVTALIDQLLLVAGDEIEVDVYFTLRRRLETTTTITTTLAPTAGATTGTTVPPATTTSSG